MSVTVQRQNTVRNETEYKIHHRIFCKYFLPRRHTIHVSLVVLLTVEDSEDGEE
jgi:hypothetical protein